MLRAALAGLAVVLAFLGALVGDAAAADSGRPEAERFRLAGCDEAAAGRLEVTTSTRLDPSCVYSGADITASDVVLDCRGARIEGPASEGGIGILVQTPAAVALRNVTVRNCVVKGFLNSIRIQREGFKELPAGGEYEAASSDLVVRGNRLSGSRGSGVFVDGYVTDVTLRGNRISGAGSVGIYLEAGSKDNLVAGNVITGNGYGDVVPEGVPFDFEGVQLRYQSTGREGIAIDGSRDNVVRGNRIAGNAAGGIFLYKNCGEYMSRERRHWVRRYGAEGNLILDNRIASEKTGVWIGSRMAENQYFLECSDPAYVSEPLRRIHRDYAANNTVQGNRFTDVAYGVRIEDDGARVTGNRFKGSGADSLAVLLGTKERTAVLGEPVRDAVIRRNRARIRGNPLPYRWIHGQLATRFADNRAQGGLVPLVEGAQPTINPFLFVISVWAEPPLSD